MEIMARWWELAYLFVLETKASEFESRAGHMNRLTKIEDYTGTTSELVKDIGNLRYDILSRFLKMLHHKLDKDGGDYIMNNEEDLCVDITLAGESIREAAESVSKAWKYSRSHIEDEDLNL